MSSPPHLPPQPADAIRSWPSAAVTSLPGSVRSGLSLPARGTTAAAAAPLSRLLPAEEADFPEADLPDHAWGQRRRSDCGDQVRAAPTSHRWRRGCWHSCRCRCRCHHPCRRSSPAPAAAAAAAAAALLHSGSAISCFPSLAPPPPRQAQAAVPETLRQRVPGGGRWRPGARLQVPGCVCVLWLPSAGNGQRDTSSSEMAHTPTHAGELRGRSSSLRRGAPGSSAPRKPRCLPLSHRLPCPLMLRRCCVCVRWLPQSMPTGVFFLSFLCVRAAGNFRAKKFEVVSLLGGQETEYAKVRCAGLRWAAVQLCCAALGCAGLRWAAVPLCCAALWCATVLCCVAGCSLLRPCQANYPSHAWLLPTVSLLSTLLGADQEGEPVQQRRRLFQGPADARGRRLLHPRTAWSVGPHATAAAAAAAAPPPLGPPLPLQVPLPLPLWCRCCCLWRALPLVLVLLLLLCLCLCSTRQAPGISHPLSLCRASSTLLSAAPPPPPPPPPNPAPGADLAFLCALCIAVDELFQVGPGPQRCAYTHCVCLEPQLHTVYVVVMLHGMHRCSGRGRGCRSIINQNRGAAARACQAFWSCS